MSARRRPPAPSVGIVIPTHDRAAMLAEAVESVVSQDYEPLEVLVLDDGSSDRTPQLLSELAAANPGRLRWLRHENIGQVRTLNRGFELVRGELLGYLSDDDLLAPGSVARLSAVLDADAGAVAVYPAVRMLDEDGVEIDVARRGQYTLAESLRRHETIVGAGALVRRWVVERVGGWDPTLRFLPDFDFWARVSMHGHLRYVPELLACERRHDGSITVAEQGSAMAHEHLDVVDRIFTWDDLPADVLAVREPAYRAAMIDAARLVSGGLNSPQDRFKILDDRDPETSKSISIAERNARGKVVLLRQRLAKRNAKVKRLNERLDELRRRVEESLEGEAHGGIPANRLIWIFATPRSGSTWLAHMLGDLGDNVLWDEPYVGDLFGNFRNRMGALLDGRHNILSRRFREAWLRGIRSLVLEGAAARFPGIASSGHCIIKEPNGSMGSDLLSEALPESSLIRLIRDPRDVVASLVAAYRKGGWLNAQLGGKVDPDPDADPERFVREHAEVCTQLQDRTREAYERHRGPKAVVRYEALRVKPLGELERICRELGLVAKPDELRDVVERHAFENVARDAKGPNERIRSASPGSWRQELSDEHVAIVERIAAPIIGELASQG